MGIGSALCTLWPKGRPGSHFEGQSCPQNLFLFYFIIIFPGALIYFLVMNFSSFFGGPIAFHFPESDFFSPPAPRHTCPASELPPNDNVIFITLRLKMRRDPRCCALVPFLLSSLTCSSLRILDNTTNRGRLRSCQSHFNPPCRCSAHWPHPQTMPLGPDLDQAQHGSP